MSKFIKLDMEDSTLSEHVAQTLRHRIAWTPETNWMIYDGAGLWVPGTDSAARDVVRIDLLRLYHLMTEQEGITLEEAKGYTGLLSNRKIDAVAKNLKGMLEKPITDFDADPELLNMQVGVIDLRTLKVTEHSPEHYFTKRTKVSYNPNAQHADWDSALSAVNDSTDVRDWMQMNYGQAITGYPGKYLGIQTANGQNGKSLFVNTIAEALGNYCTKVPKQVLMGREGDHPTELMTLRGARLALVEELPEGHQLPSARLKTLVQTKTIEARMMYKDFVSYTATHTLFVNTNFVPQVAETDKGTWRRLQLIRFPYTFVDEDELEESPNNRLGDPELESRLEDNVENQLEAVLRWLVDGAHRYLADPSWIDNKHNEPATIAMDTLEWRGESDLVMAFCRERIVFEQGAAIASADFYSVFSLWLEESGKHTWTETTLANRFRDHELAVAHKVEKKTVRATSYAQSVSFKQTPTTGSTYKAWTNVRFL